MPISVTQLQGIVDAALDWHIKNDVKKQTIQDKPLLKAMWEKRKSFTGGKEFITRAVRGRYSADNLQGYEYDDTVTYREIDPANRAKYRYYEMHDGFKITHTELKRDGISVSDSDEPQELEGREKHVLHDILKDKMEAWDEEQDRDKNLMLWRDGTADPLKPAGIMALIAANPTTGTIGGFDRATYQDGTGKYFWRNRARTGSLTTDATNGTGAALTGGTASSQTVILFLQKEWRQLRRYGGARSTLWLAGSDMIDQIEQELRSKGNYTLEGWMNKKATDGGMADIAFKGNAIMYDPTLDDLGFAKRMYIIDTDSIELWGMKNEVDKMHKPARPTDQYVLYRAKTHTLAVCGWGFNSSGVYEIT